jgi:hypothetical protein
MSLRLCYKHHRMLNSEKINKFFFFKKKKKKIIKIKIIKNRLHSKFPPKNKFQTWNFSFEYKIYSSIKLFLLEIKLNM